MTTYNFTIKSIVNVFIGKGDATLTLTPNEDGTETYNFHAVITPVSSNVPNGLIGLPNPIFDLNGLGLLNSETFFSSQNGFILNYNLATGILDLYNLDQTIQIQGLSTPDTPATPVIASNAFDTTYNTNYNISGNNNSSRKYGCSCGSACGGVTNIINLNNRND